MLEELHELHCDAEGCTSVLRFRNEFPGKVRQRAIDEEGWGVDRRHAPLYANDYCPRHLDLVDREEV